MSGHCHSICQPGGPCVVEHVRTAYPLSKDEAPCCNARRDALGRLPIGFCGPDCQRRPR